MTNNINQIHINITESSLSECRRAMLTSDDSDTVGK